MNPCQAENRNWCNIYVILLTVLIGYGLRKVDHEKSICYDKRGMINGKADAGITFFVH